MPSYVNIGAWVGAGHDGRHLGHRGVLRADRRRRAPGRAASGSAACSSRVQAAPVIVEDGAFIGSRCVVVEGVRVGREAVLGAGVVLTGNTPVIDVTGDAPVEHRGRGARPRDRHPGDRGPGRSRPGDYGLPCGLIIGYRTEATDDKVRLNELLRDARLLDGLMADRSPPAPWTASSSRRSPPPGGRSSTSARSWSGSARASARRTWTSSPRSRLGRRRAGGRLVQSRERARPPVLDRQGQGRRAPPARCTPPAPSS